MKKELVKELYIKKIDQLKKFDKSYFEEDNPIVTDREYDHLKQEILELEKKFTFLKNKNSPTQKVGYEPSSKFKKVTHEIPMLSLTPSPKKI